MRVPTKIILLARPETQSSLLKSGCAKRVIFYLLIVSIGRCLLVVSLHA